MEPAIPAPDPFAGFIEERVAQGQRKFADLGRQLVRERAPEWLERLDPGDDRAFLEPFLFGALCAGEGRDRLDAILAGYARDGCMPSTLKVVLDARGRAHLPRLGYLIADRPGIEALVSWDAACGRYRMHEAQGGRFEEAFGLAQGRMELLLSQPPTLSTLFGNVFDDSDMGEVGRAHHAHLAAALEALGRAQPGYYRHLLGAVRRIVIFSSPRANSFAALSCHGTVFLNASGDDDTAFFIEDLAHQCGHVVLNAVTFGGDPLLDIPSDTPLRNLTGRPGERRTVGETLHAVYTEDAMIRCLDACHEDRLFDGPRGDELVARIAFVLRRFGSDASSLSRERVFTDLGEWFFANLLAGFRQAYEKHGAAARELDFSNQAYNFSYARFAEANGGFGG